MKRGVASEWEAGADSGGLSCPAPAEGSSEEAREGQQLSCGASTTPIRVQEFSKGGSRWGGPCSFFWR